MSNDWPIVPLHEILTQNTESVAVEADKTYKLLGVRLAGQGPFLREEKSGNRIQASRLNPVQPNDFIYSRLFAWRGAFGLVPDEFHGCFVSGEFPTFKIDVVRVLPKYLRLYFSRLSIWDEVEKFCTGTTKASRNRFKEQFFLAMQIPLPPLDEQRRLVARIEALAAKIEEARGLRRLAVEEAEALWLSNLASVYKPIPHTAMSLEAACEAIIDNLHSTPTYAGDEYPCVRSQDVGWGTINYSTALRVGKDEFTERTRRGEPQIGDIVYVREGDVGRCAVVDGTERFCLGQRVMMFRPNSKIIDSRFLMLQLMSTHVLQNQVLVGMTGTTSRHVNINRLRDVKVNVPNLKEQYRIVAFLDELQTRVESLNNLQKQTRAELDAFLPSVLDKAFRGDL
jgi:type I restriction enzyme, S subunit